jgi:hypothetical protein
VCTRYGARRPFAATGKGTFLTGSRARYRATRGCFQITDEVILDPEVPPVHLGDEGQPVHVLEDRPVGVVHDDTVGVTEAQTIDRTSERLSADSLTVKSNSSRATNRSPPRL